MNFLKNILTKKKVEVIELLLQGENSIIARYCYLEYYNNKIKELVFKTCTISELPNNRKLSNKIPISLIINGKGIISKTIDSESYSIEKLQNILPFVNFEEFHIADFKYNNKTQISLIRKNIITELIELLNNNHQIIQSIYIGINSLKYALDFIELSDYKIIRTPYYTINFYSNEIRDIQQEDNSNNFELLSEILIGEHYIKQENLNIFSTAILQAATSVQSLPTFEISSIKKIQENVIKSQKTASLFKFYFPFLLAFTIIHFSINRYIDIRYSNIKKFIDKNNIISAVNDSIIQKTQKKQATLNELGWDNSHNISWYADIIASNRNSKLIFTSLELNLKTNKINSKNDENGKNDIIIINGVAKDAIAVSNFINNLNNSGVFKKVKLTLYEFDLEDSIANFNIIINLPR